MGAKLNSDMVEAVFTKMLKELDYEPVRRGEWIIVRDRDGYPLGTKCSRCGRRVKNGGENYCPK